MKTLWPMGISNYMRFGSKTIRIYDGVYSIKYRFQYTNFRLFDDNSEAIRITDRKKASLRSRPMAGGERPACARVSIEN
jgi:hypothetical protein